MPTYEYVCAKCDHQFDLFQQISAKALTVCPKESCGMKRWGKGKVQRLIGAGAGLIFKGSGFYTTDYRSDGYKQSAKKESSSGTSTSGESKSSGDAKPAAKTETKAASTKPAKPKPTAT